MNKSEKVMLVGVATVYLLALASVYAAFHNNVSLGNWLGDSREEIAALISCTLCLINNLPQIANRLGYGTRLAIQVFSVVWLGALLGYVLYQNAHEVMIGVRKYGPMVLVTLMAIQSVAYAFITVARSLFPNKAIEDNLEAVEH